MIEKIKFFLKFYECQITFSITQYSKNTRSVIYTTRINDVFHLDYYKINNNKTFHTAYDDTKQILLYKENIHLGDN